MSKPIHWFRKLEESSEIREEPRAIEYLNSSTGQTIIHTGGTAFWWNNKLDILGLSMLGYTHYRLSCTNDVLAFHKLR